MRKAALFSACFLAATAVGQQVYHTTPDWQSSDRPYSTGAALADIDGDGWLDLVVSNGNDMAAERVVVYLNDGAGHFPLTPSWQSADQEYNGHLDIADVNGDGWPDVAVARLINSGGPAAKLYINHNGMLSALPEWTCTEVAPAFSIAFGDVNNDGRPDLAIGTGNAYESSPHAYKNTVHLNIGGQLQQSASWQSADTWCYDSILWTDADHDGCLDLVGIGSLTNTRVYHNNGGALDPVAAWQTTDMPSPLGVMATAGDVTGDGWRDLFVVDNNQLGGSGRLRQYNGLAAGFFSPTANWTYYDGEVSAVALADLDSDGRLDLATGTWFGRTRLFLNTGTGFGTMSSWTSAGTSTVEKIVFGDINQDGVYTVVETFPAAAGQCLFYLRHQPIQHLVAVRLNGTPLTPDQYTCSRELGWLTVGPGPGDVAVEYRCSSRLDMAVANWDTNRSNYVYYHQLVHAGDANCDGRVNNQDIDGFVLLLFDQAEYAAEFPDCAGATTCDMNGDGAVNNQDIDGFVEALFGA